jgi:hypothetical protein
MANQHTLFSTYLKYANEDQRKWLLWVFEQEGSSDRGSICEIEDKPQEKQMVVYSEEYGDVERLADLVANFQIKFEIKTHWILSWASVCSRPIPDNFGGGALVVSHGKIHFDNPEHNIQTWLKTARRRLNAKSSYPGAGYYVCIIDGGHTPILHRRFESPHKRDAYMRQIYRTHVDEESNDLPCAVNISPKGKLTIHAYPRAWFTAGQKQTSRTNILPQELGEEGKAAI